MPVLEARNIAKQYGGVVALDGVSLAVEPGTVHALLGENGAGKSTLVKTIVGAVQPDSGELFLDGTPTRFSSTLDATRHGVAVVSQELNLFPDLSVLANMFMMHEAARAGVLDRRAMRRAVQPILDELGLDISPRTALAELSLAERQLVEIGKALLNRPRVLVLDEPTSALDDRTSGRLLDIMRVLRQREVAVVFVTHILEEVMQVSDQVSIMRDGKVVLAAADRRDVTIETILDSMLGERHAPAEPAIGNAAPADSGHRIEVRGLGARGALAEVDLTATAGEIVGLAGIVGAGHRAVLEVIGGIRPMTGGTIALPGRRAARNARTLRSAVSRGVAVVSGDRSRGLVQDSPIWVNLAHVRSVSLGRDGFFLRRRPLRQRARDRVQEFGIKASDVDLPVGMLSGGNQQKVVLAKWLESQPTVLLLDDPTRGVDVGAKDEMHALVRQAGRSAVVLLCSTDLDELVSLCDRVVVFRAGRVAVELTGPALTRHSLLGEMNAVDQPVAS
ncbi:MAG: sugar ABC transporter ATP-binding protein [Actinomycetota bacterium]|nr:sugar ABC transporter ATP-binding protein [Actinomycetota bacterium]